MAWIFYLLSSYFGMAGIRTVIMVERLIGVGLKEYSSTIWFYLIYSSLHLATGIYFLICGIKRQWKK